MRRATPFLLGILLSVASACGSSDDASSSEGDVGSADDTFVDVGHDGVTVDSNAADTPSDTAPADSSKVDSSTVDSGAADSSASDTTLDTTVPDVTPDTNLDVIDASDATTVTCKATEHVCLCATGSYCLKIGFTCLAPSAPCP
jgi:hypothetical protein